MIITPPENFFDVCNVLYTDNIGLYRFNQEQVDIMMSLTASEKANDSLVGHIENEYHVDDFSPIEPMITPVVQEYDLYRGLHFETIKRFTQEIPGPELHGVWINRQKKYEYNPIHLHSGLYSFVVWLDIPYTNEEEERCSPYKGTQGGEKNSSGNFSFMDTTQGGEVAEFRIAADKQWNGTMAIFPAKLLHCVYPFYSSDKERITLAGNYAYNMSANNLA